MNNILNRKYIIISLAIHLGIILVMAYVIHSNRINKTFLVFGAHSKKPTQAIMKFGRRPYVPFLGGTRAAGNGKQGKGAGKNTKPKNDFKHISKGKHSLTKLTPKMANKKLLAKKQSVKNARIEKQPLLLAGEAAVSFHKKILVKKMQDARLKELKALEVKIAEMERRERKLLLAKRSEALRLKEISLEKAAKKQAEAEKLLLAKKEEEKRQQAVEPDDHDDDTKDIEDNNVTENGEKIFAENGQTDIMEFNLLAESDQETRVYQKSIQHEVMRLWHPPLGVSKGTTCRVFFAVGRKGNVEQFEFVTRSKMLIYDLSILRVAKQFKFDDCLWGKRFAIDFCQ